MFFFVPCTHLSSCRVCESAAGSITSMPSCGTDAAKPALTLVAEGGTAAVFCEEGVAVDTVGVTVAKLVLTLVTEGGIRAAAAAVFCDEGVAVGTGTIDTEGVCVGRGHWNCS